MSITLKDINKSYGNLTVFKNLNITFTQGKISCLLGQSGSGKTTLLNIVSGLTEYKGILEKDKGLISYIFQKERLINNLTVKGNLEYVLLSQIKDKEERTQKIKSILNMVELSEKANNYPNELSGGQQQRLSMARAFVFPSKILLMDEPFRSLDIALKKRMVNEFYKLWDKDKRTVVFVTHDIDEALMLADNIYILKGNPTEIVKTIELNTPQKERDLTNENMTNKRNEIYKILA